MKKLSKIYFWILLIFLQTVGCKNQVSNDPINGEMEESGNRILITAEQAKTLQLEVVNIKRTLVPETIYANGYIEAPPQNIASISPVVSGYVTRVNLIQGDQVKKGSDIMVIQSKELVELQKNYLQLKSRVSYLVKDTERQRTLAKDNINAKKVMDEAEAELVSSQAALEASKEILSMAGIDFNVLESGDILSTIGIKSPLPGFITEQNVVIGQFIQSGDILCEVIDPGHLHAELRVFEKDAIKIKKNQKIRLFIPQANTTIPGTVYLVNKKIDEETRTVRIHVHFEEQENILPGMYVDAEILVDERITFVLPGEGLFRGVKETIAFQILENNEENLILEKVSVVTGREKTGMLEIISTNGLAPDTTKHYIVHGISYLVPMTEKE
jgi:cobalt-zinc-cadmium efflux system membrane fusion protein